MKVKTVTGSLDRQQLGVVTTHEHVLLDLTAFYQELPGLCHPEGGNMESVHSQP